MLLGSTFKALSFALCTTAASALMPTITFAQATADEVNAALAALQAQLDSYNGPISDIAVAMDPLAAALNERLAAADSNAYLVTQSGPVSTAITQIPGKPTPQVEEAVSTLNTALGDYLTRKPISNFISSAANVNAFLDDPNTEYLALHADVAAPIVELLKYRPAYEKLVAETYFDVRAVALTNLLAEPGINLDTAEISDSYSDLLGHLVQIGATVADADVTASIDRLAQALTGNELNVPAVEDSLRTLETAIVQALVTVDPDHRKDLVSTQLAMLRTDVGGSNSKDGSINDSLDALQQLIDEARPKIGPRIRIIYAGYGDFEKDAGRDRRCNATQQVRQLCDGLDRCTLRGTLSETTCGVDPAFLSLDDRKRLVVTYACPNLGLAEWNHVVAGQMSLPKGQYPRQTVNTKLANPTITCAPRFTDPGVNASIDLNDQLVSASAAYTSFLVSSTKNFARIDSIENTTESLNDVLSIRTAEAAAMAPITTKVTALNTAIDAYIAANNDKTKVGAITTAVTALNDEIEKLNLSH